LSHFPTTCSFHNNTHSIISIATSGDDGHDLSATATTDCRRLDRGRRHRDGGFEDVDTLEDARLKDKHIGIIAGTPPATNMAMAGLMTNAKPYPLMIDMRFDNSAQAMIDDLAAGTIDAGVLWGPMASFYAKKAAQPLHVTPLVKETTGPKLVYRIGMSARPADQNWKRQLNRLIQENQGEINKTLLDFGVPLLDESDRPLGAGTAKKSP
jgi:ABC-type amino acid transport substrate-binding protein